MPEELEIVAMRNYEGTTTARDVAAVFFRQKKLFLTSFAVVLCIGVLYALFVPSYKAEMKVLVRRGRIDATVTPTETASSLEREDVTEEEMNSEVELLQDEDILRNVVLASGLAESQHWYSPLGRNGREEQIARAVKRLADKISAQPVRKSHVIAIS